MDLGLDRAIERLNALKLHTPGAPASAPATANGAPQAHGSNQREHSGEPDAASLQDQYARMAQQMQDHYERQLSEQQHALAARLQHEAQLMQRRVDALEQQNQALRRAAGEADTLRAQVADQHTHIELLQSEVKQLRLTNYRLQYMVQQNDRTSGLGGLPPAPPDIF